MVQIDFLKQVDIFKGVDEDQLKQIAQGINEKGYQSGSRIFAEGEEADRVWIVMEGQVDLRFDLPGRNTSEENTIVSITAGNSLGWSSFVPPFQYRLSAYCATRSCKMLLITKEFLTDLFEKDNTMGYRVISNLAGVAGMHFHELQNSATVPPTARVKITVHMATCGIAAGAREIMNTLVNELAQIDRQDIKLASGGCIGKCATEPNVTVEIGSKDTVVYQRLTPEKIRQIFKKHILEGEVQEEFRLT